MKARWNNIEEKLLLDSFEDEPSLYRGSDPNFYNKPYKDEAWNRIINKIQKIKPATTKTEVKNKIHNMKKKYVKIHLNSLRGNIDQWEWSSRIKYLFQDLDLKNTSLLDNSYSTAAEDEEGLYIEYPPDEDNMSDLSENLILNESQMENETSYYNIKPKRKRETDSYNFGYNDIGSNKNPQKKKTKNEQQMEEHYQVQQHLQLQQLQQQQQQHQHQHHPQQSEHIIDPMTHHFGLFVESQLNLVNDRVKKNEIISKLTKCLLDETTQFLKEN